MRKNFTLFCGALLSLVALTANAQTISQLSFYSPLISTFDMQYGNDHLVVAQQGLLVFDVSNPGQRPKTVAQVTYPGSTARQLAIDHNTVYMAYGSSGYFSVYDVTDFTNPLLQGSVKIPYTAFSIEGDVTPYGNYVYLSGFDTLYVVDVTDKAAPAVANALPAEHTAFGGITDMKIDGHTLCIKSPLALLIYDIRNPVQPVLINRLTYNHAVNSGLIADTVHHRMFIPWISPLQDFTGHDAYDVADPLSPKLLFSDSTVQGSGDFGNGAYAYANDIIYFNVGSIRAFDVSAASHGYLTSFSGQDVPNATVAIDVKDSIIFNARGGGIEVLQYSSESEIACQAPVYLRSTSPSVTAYLRWNEIDGANGYRVGYRATGASQWTEILTIDNMQRIHNLLPNTTYQWNVKTICNARPPDVSVWSGKASFTTGNQAENILIMPNPVKDLMRIKISGTVIANSLVIVDAQGMRHMNVAVSGNNATVNVQQLKPGNYILEIYDKYGNKMGSSVIYKQ